MCFVTVLSIRLSGYKWLIEFYHGQTVVLSRSPMLPIGFFYLAVNRSFHFSLNIWLIECARLLSVWLSTPDFSISPPPHLLFLSGYLPGALVWLEPSVESDGRVDVRREVSGHVEHRHPQRARRPQHRLPVGRDLARDAQVRSIHVRLK